MQWLLDRLDTMKGETTHLTPKELETVVVALREYCLARAHADITHDGPLTDEAWRAVSLSGQLQEQAHREIEHAKRIERESAGLDGRIEIVFGE